MNAKRVGHKVRFIGTLVRLLLLDVALNEIGKPLRPARDIGTPWAPDSSASFDAET